MDTSNWRLATVLAAVCGALVAAAPGMSASPPPKVVTSMHWYRWHPSERTLQGVSSRVGSEGMLGLASMRELAAIRSGYGLHVLRAFPQLRAAEVAFSRSLLVGAARDRRIRYLSPLGPARHPMALPNDPLASTLDPITGLPWEWQFGAAHVDQALDYSQGSPSILVGTIDTGAADVPDLAGKVDQRWTVSPKGKVAKEAQPFDVIGHGTAVASLIAANVGDGFGMAGFGGASHLVVMHAWTLTDLATAAALMKLDSLGVRIVNLSFGSDARESPIMLDAIHKAEADGMLLVAAAGNSSHAVAHPAADLQPAGGARSYGLAVGASDVNGDRAFFSNSGAHLSLLAPGVYDGDCSGVLAAVVPASTDVAGSCYPIWTGTDGAQYGYLAGTSFAAPEVAGVAALVWAARPQLTNYEVADILKQSAQRGSDGWTPTAGFGVLDAGTALQLATSQSNKEWAVAASARSPDDSFDLR